MAGEAGLVRIGGGGLKVGGAGGLPVKGVWEAGGVEGTGEEHGAQRTELSHFLDVGMDSRSFTRVSLWPSVSLVALGVDGELSLLG